MDVIKNWTGNKLLDEKTLDPILESLNKDLQSKNVAYDVAHQIVKNLRVLLLNKTSDSYKTVFNYVKNNLFDSIKNILTFDKDIDIVNDAKEHKRKNLSNMN